MAQGAQSQQGGWNPSNGTNGFMGGMNAYQHPSFSNPFAITPINPGMHQGAQPPSNPFALIPANPGMGGSGQPMQPHNPFSLISASTGMAPPQHQLAPMQSFAPQQPHMLAPMHPFNPPQRPMPYMPMRI